MSEPFGFMVRQSPANDRDDQTGWAVSLPHQCDRWDIAGEEYHPEPDHAKAVAEMQRFVAEAFAALAALVDRQNFGKDEFGGESA